MSLFDRWRQRKQLAAAADLREGAAGWSAVVGAGAGGPWGGRSLPDDARRQYDDALLAWRTNPYAKRIIDIITDYTVGDGLTPVAPGDSTWRPAGSDGQILVYVNQTTQAHPAVAVGVCLPAGGPEQFAATRATVTLP